MIIDIIIMTIHVYEIWFYFKVIFFIQLKQAEPVTVWIAVSEDSVTLLELQTMAVMCRYNYANIVTFGGCLDDFMLVACPDEGAAEQKLLFALSKPKVRNYNAHCQKLEKYLLHLSALKCFSDFGDNVIDRWLYERARPCITGYSTNEYFNT